MDFRQQWKRKISRQKQLQKDEGEKTLEEKETKNKFWKGVLVGALVTAFAGFAVVGFATGIWVIWLKISRAMMFNLQPEKFVKFSVQWNWNRITAKMKS